MLRIIFCVIVGVCVFVGLLAYGLFDISEREEEQMDQEIEDHKY